MRSQSILAVICFFYRAEAPVGLIEREERAWDPVLAWAREIFCAHFVLTQGVVHVSNHKKPSRPCKGSFR